MEPSFEELLKAFTYAIECQDIAGARAQSRMELAELRNRKFSWVGEKENSLRFSIDKFLR